MYSTHKRHKGFLLISLNRQCTLLSEVVQEEKPWVWLLLFVFQIPKPSAAGTFNIFPMYIFFAVLSKFSQSLVAFWVELLALSEPCSIHSTLLPLPKPDFLLLQSL